MFGKTNYIHFVGIGGIGMSGMAELLYKLGFQVSGSDISVSERTIELQRLGISISNEHATKNINSADVVVYSSAVQKDNPEIQETIKKQIPLIRRAEMLAELLKVKNTSIAIAGTHGKTTTCSMLGSILTEANKEPTLVIGGIVNKFQSNNISGDGDIIVVEADEFDRSFLTLHPTIGLITNLDLEHLDCYENLSELQDAFVQFANAVPFYGKLAICTNHINCSEILTKIKRPLITFGVDIKADVVGKNIKYNKDKTTFDLNVKNNYFGQIVIQVPGEHNVRNAIGAIAIALELDISFNKIKLGLEKYNGVRRRFEIKYTTINNILIIDDYAHHPEEVYSTIKAAKLGWGRRLITIFQPHLFSRTRDFFKDFAKALEKSDIVIITKIYQAREAPIEGISAEIIVDELKQNGYDNIISIPDQTKIPEYISKITKSKDMIITMGAGDIWKQCKTIKEKIDFEYKSTK